jgi:hypothetical protein
VVPWAPYTPPLEPAPAPAPSEQATVPAQQEAVQPTAATEAPFTPSTPTRKAREGEGGGMGLLVPFLILPLLLWAIGATAIAVFLYNRLVSIPSNSFDRFLDDTGDNQGVKHRKVSRWSPKRALRPLPDNLLVNLKGTIRLGALEVTPLSVVRRKVKIFTEGAEGKPEFLPHDCLVLNLRITNRAEDYSFAPMDNYFDRVSTGKGDDVPLTILQAGKANFFGGPAKWYPLNGQRQPGERRDWLVGRTNVDREGLQPGKSMDTLVCTNGDDPRTVEYLFGVDKDGNKVGKPYSGKMLWRVHLRRGLIEYEGRQLPAQCVIGVEFDSKDIKKG